MLSKLTLERMKEHGAKLEFDGKPTNFAIDVLIHQEFTRCCKILDIEPDVDVYVESVAKLGGDAVGMAHYDEGNMYIEIDFNYIKRHRSGVRFIVAHEMAHIATFRKSIKLRRRFRAHGKNFQKELLRFGYDHESYFSHSKYAN